MVDAAAFAAGGAGRIPITMPKTCTIIPPSTMDVPTTTTTLSSKNIFDGIACELQTLAVEYGMLERQQNNRSRNKLQPRHGIEFTHPTQLFDKLARVVCQVSVIPRKELFETWAMALYVHRTFFSTRINDESSPSVWTSSSTSSSSTSNINNNKDNNHNDDEVMATNDEEADIPITRIADIACSHGLLSWALLLLSRYDERTGEPLYPPSLLDDDDDDYYNDDCEKTNEEEQDQPKQQQQQQRRRRRKRRQLSVVCIDLNMPKSAEKLAIEMLKEWPDLHQYWDYIEGPLEAIIPSQNTLLVGIHACGILSDKLISHTIQGGCPLALVPCCHSKKCLSVEQRSSWMKSQRKTTVASSTSPDDSSTTTTADNIIPMMKKSYTLADIIDEYRVRRLDEAGFEVHEAIIPEEFTPKNRIILAKPKDAKAKLGLEHFGPQSMRSKDQHFQNNTKPIPDWAKPKFMIPLADTPKDRATVHSLAGREAANNREAEEKQQQQAARSVHLSLYLPPDNIHLSAQALEPTLGLEGGEVEALCPEPFLHPTAGRYVRTFKVTFPKDASKAQCRDYFAAMRQKIPDMIPGACVRY